MSMQTSVEIDVADPARIEAMLDTAIDKIAENAEPVAEDIVATAQGEVNVDTGRLRDSLDNELTRVADYVLQVATGSDVEYGPFQEMMYPYLRPAILEHKDDLLEAMERGLIEAAEDHDLR